MYVETLQSPVQNQPEQRHKGGESQDPSEMWDGLVGWS
jgi:hypothetical protein